VWGISVGYLRYARKIETPIMITPIITAVVLMFVVAVLFVCGLMRAAALGDRMMEQCIRNETPDRR
jgi:hypothetical protein